MRGSLGPVGNGAKASLNRTAIIYTGGLLIGAGLAGSFLSLLGAGLETAGLHSVALFLVFVSLAAAGMQVFGLRPPQSRWQVPEGWRRLLDADLLAAFYGFLLGLGGLTAIVVAAFWVFASLSLAIGAGPTLAGWATYALTRGAGYWITARRDRRRTVRDRFSPRLHRVLVASSASISLSVVGSYLYQGAL